MIYYELVDFGPIVYRLGHELFMLGRGVRLSLGLPNLAIPSDQPFLALIA
jgi:hypothetical protein